jgi:cell division protein FtsL
VVVVATVASLYLLIVSRVARQGRNIQAKSETLAEWRRENSHLEVQVARAASAHVLIERAIALDLDLPDFDQIVFVKDGGD